MWLLGILVAVLMLAGCNTKATQEPSTTTLQGSAASSSSNIIEITDSGFSPTQITIQKGESLTFINKGAAESWPASAVHPTHQVYPGSDIAKCNSPEQATIFDACRGLKQGESWSFTFSEPGNWKYHDHLNPGLRGQVDVQ